MDRSDNDSALTDVAAEAVDWFVRLKDSPEDPAVRADFADWLRRSPHHVGEYLQVLQLWTAAAPASQGEYSSAALIAAARASHDRSNVIAFLKRPDAKAPAAGNRRGIRTRRMAAAAAALLAVGLALGAWRYHDWNTNNPRFATGPTEERSVKLADGSVLHLNEQSAVRVTLGAAQRRIELVRGEARFDVARNPRRPFIVIADRIVVRALGTVFNVKVSPTQTAVTVLEGRVEVSGGDAAALISRGRGVVVDAAATHARSGVKESARLELGAGERAAVSASGGLLAGAGPTVEQVEAWSEKRLVFREQTLASVVAEFNRYNAKTLRIDDAALGALLISGAFNASDPVSLVEYLQRFEAVQVMPQPDGTITLDRE